MNAQHCISHRADKFCERFNCVIDKCPAHCVGREDFQLDLLATNALTAELDEWISNNPIPYDAICNEFVRQGFCGIKRISVRDIWSWARTNYTGVKRADNSDYIFNNNLTPALSQHLCEKYPQFADKVQHRGAYQQAVKH